MKKIEKKKLLLTILFAIIGLIYLYPFIWAVFSSLKPLNEIYQFPPKLFSPNMSLDNYKYVLFEQNPSFLLYLLNTIFVTLVSVSLSVAISITAGYAFAKLKFAGRNKIFILLLITMMIPFQVLMIPQFVLLTKMGLYNTLWALILPTVFTPLGTFLMRQYFLSVPDSIIESGRIDGASEFTIFKNLVVPIAKPAVATVIILTFMWRWNDYESPLIFINDATKYTLTLGLSNFVDEAGVAKDNLIMAAATISMIPMIIVYFVLQKQMIAGLTQGSNK